MWKSGKQASHKQRPSYLSEAHLEILSDKLFDHWWLAAWLIFVILGTNPP